MFASEKALTPGPTRREPATAMFVHRSADAAAVRSLPYSSRRVHEFMINDELKSPTS